MNPGLAVIGFEIMAAVYPVIGFGHRPQPKLYRPDRSDTS